MVIQSGLLKYVVLCSLQAGLVNFNQSSVSEQAGKLIFVNTHMGACTDTHIHKSLLLAVYSLWSLSITIATHPANGPKGKRVWVWSAQNFHR